MILQELKNDEAKAFIKLIESLANQDKIVKSKEKELIYKYLEKLDLRDEEIELSYEQARSIIEASSSRVKKIVYFEMVGVALSDDNYEMREVDFIEELGEKFGITRADKIAVANYYYDYDSLSELTDESLSEKIEKIISI